MEKILFYKKEILPWFFDYFYKIEKTASFSSLLNDLKIFYPNDDQLKYTKEHPKTDNIDATEQMWYEPNENTYICFYMYKVQADLNDKETTKYARLEGISIMERGHNFPKSYVILYSENEKDKNVKAKKENDEQNKEKDDRPSILGYYSKENTTMVSLLKDINDFNCPELFKNGLYSFGDKKYTNLENLKEYAEKQKTEIMVS